MLKHSILFFLTAFSAVATATEHIVIIDQREAGTPDIAGVLQKIGLDLDHQNVSAIWNNSAFAGFAATIKPKHIGCLENMTDVLIVEKSIKVAHTGLISRDARMDMMAERDAAPISRAHATWGLQRISSTSFSATNAKTLDYTYQYTDDSLGDGADIYILDSGIWTEHHAFQDRAQMVWSFDGNMTDRGGHGTHVAGTAGGIDFGVASNANIFGLRVLGENGAGSTATVIAGIDHVLNMHELRKKSVTGFKGSVISMSLAAQGRVSSLDSAVAAAIGAGIHVCVAAGNEGADACQKSPAANGGVKGGAISVGSIGISGKRSDFSNYGSCVDVYAPGEDVLSAGLKDPNLLAFLSGTSQATPHITGLVAYAMSNSTLASNPALMKQWIVSHGLPSADGTLIANNGATTSSDAGNDAGGAISRVKSLAAALGLKVAAQSQSLQSKGASS